MIHHVMVRGGAGRNVTAFHGSDSSDDSDNDGIFEYSARFKAAMQAIPSNLIISEAPKPGTYILPPIVPLCLLLVISTTLAIGASLNIRDQRVHERSYLTLGNWCIVIYVVVATNLMFAVYYGKLCLTHPDADEAYRRIFRVSTMGVCLWFVTASSATWLALVAGWHHRADAMDEGWCRQDDLRGLLATLIGQWIVHCPFIIHAFLQLRASSPPPP